MLFSRPKKNKTTLNEELYYINSEKEMINRFSSYSVIKKEFKKMFIGFSDDNMFVNKDFSNLNFSLKIGRAHV